MKSVEQPAARIQISVISPMHNEEGNVIPLHDDISRVMTELGQAYEIIVVNDVSSDATLTRMKDIQCRDPHFHFLDLATNVGENWALLAGVSKARGEVLVTIDGDGQNDPAYIPALLQKLSNGYRVVSGRRRQRVEKLWTRLLPSHIANGLIRAISRVSVHDCGCGLKAYSREVLEGKFVPEGFMNRFSPVALGVRPEEFAEIEVIDRPRGAGTSHYGLNRVFFVLRDLAALPFALRGAARWLRVFRPAQWISLATSALFALLGRWIFSAGAAVITVIAVSYVWNLKRFVSAQSRPEFRIKQYR
jgi:glycosyltransferase involved in cell wall biosynthesis